MAHGAASLELAELAWAAGFYDGEGCTTADPRAGSRGWLRLRMVVVQVDARPLRRFARAVGAGDMAWTWQQTRQRGHWRWRASDRAARQALTALWPFLSTPKREQALAALACVNAVAAYPWLPPQSSALALLRRRVREH